MFSDAMNNILPTDWLDPYGRMPMAQGMPASVDITIVETDDGIKASSVKNPPQAGPSRMMQAIKEALGLDFGICTSACGSLQASDQGLRRTGSKSENAEESQDSDIMKTSSSGDSGYRDRNPGSQGSPEPDRQGEEQDEDEKAPRKS